MSNLANIIRFKEISHKYESVVPDGRTWKSVTGIVEHYIPEFDSISISEKCSRNSGSDYYGLEPSEIREIWAAENRRSTELGSWFHQRAESLEPQENICRVEDGWKYAGNQVLTDGVYPEFILYHPEYNVCGTADRIEVVDNKCWISDWKTGKKIDKVGFRDKKMLYPANKLPDCEIGHYTLQLSLYALILQYHNPQLVIEELMLRHVLFEVENYDRWSYPIIKLDTNGEPVVKEIVNIKVNYEREIAEAVLKHHKYGR